MPADTIHAGPGSPGVGHPAPHRRRANWLTLILGVGAGPVAFAGQMILDYGLTSRACSSGVGGTEAPSWLASVVVCAAAVLLCFVGAGVSYGRYRATAREANASDPRLLDAGEGRTRFLAISGILMSLGFLVAVLVDSIGMILMRSCAG